jgi:hypothetical protein
MMMTPALGLRHSVVLTASPVAATDIGTTAEKLKELR